MINKAAIAVTLVLMLLISTLTWAAFHYYGAYTAKEEENKTLAEANAGAALVISNQARLFTIFNTIAGATHDAQANNTAASHDRQVVIKTIIQTEACAPGLVPAAAGDILLKHYNEVRANTGDANTVQPNSTVSSESATK